MAASASAIWRLELRADSPFTTTVAGACPAAGAGGRAIWKLELRAPPLTTAMAASAGAIWRLELRANPFLITTVACACPTANWRLELGALLLTIAI